jgi:hypothetical protein
MHRKTTLILAISALLSLLSVASVLAYTYFEDFEGVPSGSSIADCGWVGSTIEKDMQVAENRHAAWTGNCAYGKSSIPTGSYPGFPNSYYELLPGMPSTGVLQFTCKAWGPNPYPDLNYYYGAGAIGLGDSSGNNLVNWSPASSNTDMWMFDARNMGATYCQIVKPGLKDIFENDLTVQLQIFVDQTAKLLWGVIQGPGGTFETPRMPYTSTTAIGSAWMYQSNDQWKDCGIDVDDISVRDGGTLGDNITLEDYSGDLSISPVKIQLTPTGTDGGANAALTVILSANPGTYSIPVAAGTYSVTYSACKCKTLVKPWVVIGGGANVVENATLLNGDADGDNSITSTDASIVLKNKD